MPKAKLCKSPRSSDPQYNLALETVQKNIDGCMLTPRSQLEFSRIKPTAVQQYQSDLINPPVGGSHKKPPLAPNYSPTPAQRRVNDSINPPSQLTPYERSQIDPFSVSQPSFGDLPKKPSQRKTSKTPSNSRSIQQEPVNSLTDSQVLRMTLEEKLVWAIIDGQIKSIEKIIDPNSYVSQKNSSVTDLAQAAIPEEITATDNSQKTTRVSDERVAQLSQNINPDLAKAMTISVNLTDKWQEYSQDTASLPRYDREHELKQLDAKKAEILANASTEKSPRSKSNQREL
jgi:hypothetical protein